jgi:biopolymer transport protein ExbB
MISHSCQLWLTLLAQVPGDGGSLPSANAVHVQSVWDFVLKGGPMMWPILVCSLIAMTVVVERLITLSRDRVIPKDFVGEVTKRLSGTPGDPQRALEYCKKDGSHIAKIFATAIKRLGQPVELLERHISDAGAREVRKLRKRLRVLSVIGAMAPLMGLLGTIFGMIEAFQTVAASGEALGKTELLAKGIYEAMITTAAGLLLAIPVLVAYNALSAKIDALIAEMDEKAADFVEQFALRKSMQAKTKPVRPGKNGDRDPNAIVQSDSDFVSDSDSKSESDSESEAVSLTIRDGA